MTDSLGDESTIPLSAPYYGATFRIAVRRFWKKYAIFSGRASLSEFWWALLFFAIIAAGFDIVSLPFFVLTSFGNSSISTTTYFWLLGVFAVITGTAGIILAIPTYAVTVRRLHDTDRSGWYGLLVLIPYVGGIILIVMLVRASNPLGARFDVVPADDESSTA